MNALNLRYIEMYQNMTEEERHKNHLVLDLDFVIGGKPDLLLELLSIIDCKDCEPSLELIRMIKALENELGVN